MFFITERIETDFSLYLPDTRGVPDRKRRSGTGKRAAANAAPQPKREHERLDGKAEIIPYELDAGNTDERTCS